MITVQLKRMFQDGAGMHGGLYLNDKFLCFTEELPDLGNKEDLSCIPYGSYHCSPHNSADHPHTWQLNDVEGRTNVLIHNGNTMKDTKGCILVGQSRGSFGVLQSVLAMNTLRKILPNEFMLEIIAAHTAHSDAFVDV